jgi:regulator of sigma E protease
MFKKFKSLLIAFFGLSAVIVVHELGHFLFCKLFGVKVPIFSVGFGPKLIGYKIGGTLFQIAALPLGGYNAIDTASFATKTYIQKMIITLAGIGFNIIFAVLLLIFIAWYANRKQSQSSNIFTAIGHGIVITYAFCKNITQAFFGIWQKKNREQLTGPIGIITSSQASQARGCMAFMLWLAIMNINVAIFNILPIPFLDGGQLVHITIEALYGGPLPKTIISLVNNIFLLLFLFFIIWLSMRDMRRKMPRS